MEIVKVLKKIWHFIWDDDSIWSWLANIVLAFVLIKYIVYPGLGFMLMTDYPIVAVVSNSMHHEQSFDMWWDNAKGWYESNNINKDLFETFPMKGGFNKGDIMILAGVNPKTVKVGDIIVFQSGKPDPIIHRIVKKTEEGDKMYYQTKGDNYITNPTPIQTNGIDETMIHHDLKIVKGKAILRIPFLGYVKIMALRTICFFDSYGYCPAEYQTI